MVTNNGRHVFSRSAMILAAIFLLTFMSFLHANCQEKDRKAPPVRERLFFGGNFGLQLGTITDIQFSPVAGFWVLPRLGIAAGPSFRYYKDPWDRTTIYGGRSYLQFIVLQDLDNIVPLGVHFGLFLHTEYEALSLESSVFKTLPYTSERFIAHTILGGGGLSQQIGRRSSLNIMFLWALNDDGYSIYNNPEIRVGFVF